MRYLAALSLALVLLLGCTGQAPPGANNTTQPPAPQPTPQPSGGGYGYSPPVNTTQNDTLAPSVADNASNNSSPPVMNTSFVPPKPPTYNFTNVTTADGRLIVYYFFSPRCGACAALRPDMDRLEAKYPNVDWQEYDLTTQNGTLAYIEFADENNLSAKQRLVPQVLVDRRIITDRFNINGTLEGVIINYTTSNPSPYRGST